MTVTLPPENRTVVENVCWSTYVSQASARRGAIPRMTYDRGRMELMSPGKQHESIKTLLGRLVAAFAEMRDIDIVSVASTTLQREDLERGFEADESFYIAHADDVRSKEEINLAVDPPPDLVIEIEITSSAIKKLDLFAAIGIAEVWRHDGQRLRIFHLQESGYQEQASSTVLSGFPLVLADSIISQRLDRGEVTLLKEFRERIRSLS